MTFEIRPARASELEQHAALHDEGYGLPAGSGTAYVAAHETAGLVDRMLGAYDGRGRLVGRLVVLPFGQFFGGRPIPMGGIGAVVVAADQRGRGVGRALLDGAIAHMREHGEVISALSPATVSVYRNAGWELAGDQCVYGVPTRLLAELDGLDASPLRERPAEPTDDDAIKRTYVRAAAARNGMLARPAFVWAPRLAADPGRRRFVVERSGDITGYLSYSFHRQTRGGYNVFVDDFAALDWDSELALWRHLAGHRAQAEEIAVFGVPLDALALHLDEPTIHVVHAHRWMLRLVDVAAAIAGRGFPAGVHASVPVSITDPRVAANEGTWQLEVDGGRGTLTRAPGSGAGPTPAISINGLAPLFSGATSARTLAAAGMLSGATSEQLATLDALFAGPTPAMNDRF